MTVHPPPPEPLATDGWGSGAGVGILPTVLKAVPVMISCLVGYEKLRSGR